MESSTIPSRFHSPAAHHGARRASLIESLTPIVAVTFSLLFVPATGLVIGCSYDYRALEASAPDGSVMIRGSGGRSLASGGAGVLGGSGGVSGSGGSFVAGSGGAGAASAGGAGGPRGGDGGGGREAGATGGNGGVAPLGGAQGNRGGSGLLTGGQGGRSFPGATGGQGGVGLKPFDPNTDTALVLWYAFDEASGTVAANTAPGATAASNAMLSIFGVGGEISFTPTHLLGSHSVAITGNGIAGGGYLNMPNISMLAPQAITVTAWVNFSTAGRWQRIFESGTTYNQSMALTTTDASNHIRFVIRTNGVGTEQLIETTTTLAVSEWHLLAVVLPATTPYAGQIFVDGVLAGSNSSMTFHPADLGGTPNNYLGRSENLAYPYPTGFIDDFRVYRRALTAAELKLLPSR